MHRITLALLVSLTWGVAAHADIIFQDDFDYGVVVPTTITTANPTDYTAISAGSDSLLNVTPEGTLDVGVISSNPGTNTGVTVDLGGNQSAVYVGFDIVVSDVINTNNRTNFQFLTSGGNSRGTFNFVDAGSSTTWTFNQNEVSPLPPALPKDTTLRIVLFQTGGTMRAWAGTDPSDFVEGSPYFQDGNGGGSVNRFVIRAPQQADYTVDNLIIATTFEEAVPEPGTLALAGLGLLLMVSRRRRSA